MKFVPVPGTNILMCIHETRRKDYATYASAAPGADSSWKAPVDVLDGKPLSQNDDHPVIMVSWEDANAFCTWLSKKEGRTYRLPTEHEWNLAVVTNLDKTNSISPADLAKKLEGQYPWGTTSMSDAPKHGNYGSRDGGRDAGDDYAGTAPVMSFLSNHLGIYDLGGNAWEWCDGWFNPDQKERVLRGSGYLNYGSPRKSNWRLAVAPTFRIPPPGDYNRRVPGFRCVLESAPSAAATAIAAAVPTSPSLPISKSSDPKFPPGQWVKVFTRFEDLTVENRMPDSGVKWEAGRFVPPPGKKIAMNVNSFPRGKNHGIRAVYEVSGPANSGEIRVRSTGSSYVLEIDGRSHLDLFFNERMPDGKFNRREVRKIGPLSAWKPGSTVPVELCVVGTRLFARVDGLLVLAAEDASAADGGLGLINVPIPVRDIEVINLDGLSDAEALKIVGVDEKGNDTRAAAHAAETLAMEQAKEEDAISAIPELKALHDQFAKLTAERVAAPFEADVAKLNSGYVGGIDRKIAEEKAAGHLDGVIALQAEKKLLADQQPIPAEDAADIPPNLKALRAIYRAAYVKIDAARATNLKTLTEPLTLRLKQLEADLTRKDRIDDAKTVREYREKLAVASPANTVTPAAAPAAAAAPLIAKDGYTNTLGMKFVPVKGTTVMFCIHEVRYQDYAAYAAETPGIDGYWKDQSNDGYTPTENKEQHPVNRVSWEDAQKFCAWLSKKEGKTYRLPTDHEWSYAVGLGREEKWKKDTTPATVEKNQTEFPWGDKWPPPKGSGNFSDDSRKAKAPMAFATYLENYDDGFPTTAPVMRFKPNKFGLYDLEGNVREWVEDWNDNAQKDHVLRGGCWNNFGRIGLLSSFRDRPQAGGSRYYDHNGFRVVMVVSVPNSAAN